MIMQMQNNDKSQSMCNFDLLGDVSHHLLPNSSQAVTVQSDSYDHHHLYFQPSFVSKQIPSLYKEDKQWISGEIAEYISQKGIDFSKWGNGFLKMRKWIS